MSSGQPRPCKPCQASEQLLTCPAPLEPHACLGGKKPKSSPLPQGPFSLWGHMGVGSRSPGPRAGDARGSSIAGREPQPSKGRPKGHEEAPGCLPGAGSPPCSSGRAVRPLFWTLPTGLPKGLVHSALSSLPRLPRPNPGCGAGASFVRWLRLLHRESGLTSPRASALGPSLQGSLLALTCLGVLECPGRPKQEQAEKRGHRWPRSQVWFSHARPEKEKGRLGGEGPAPGSFPATGGPGNVGWPSAERVTNPTLAICWAGWAT